MDQFLLQKDRKKHTPLENYDAMSDTPRTDALERKYGSSSGTPWNEIRDFARTLERKNAAMREAIQEAHKIIDVLYMDALDHHKESWPRAREWMEQWEEMAK